MRLHWMSHKAQIQRGFKNVLLISKQKHGQFCRSSSHLLGVCLHIYHLSQCLLTVNQLTAYMLNCIDIKVRQCDDTRCRQARTNSVFSTVCSLVFTKDNGRFIFVCHWEGLELFWRTFLNCVHMGIHADDLAYIP